MNILVICQYYYPEPVRITDICEELVKSGNKVTVLTDIPNYPMGKIYKEYNDNKKRIEIIKGVEIHRCYTIPRGNNILMRFLNYHSFSFFSKKYINKLNDDYDVVLVNQLSPVMMANAGIKYKKKYGKKILMYCLDIWPESLCAGGIKKDSLIYKIYFKISKNIYNQIDKILVTSKSFIKYLKESFDIDEDKIEYLPQYAESVFDVKSCKKENDGNIDLLFAGNIGKAQNLKMIVEAAKILKNINNLYFHIVGDGQELDNIKKEVEELNLNNIIFYGRKPLIEMPNFYKKADAMLVTLCGDSLISLTLPGKVQTYMAAGKPIIASANGETQEVIKKANCGFYSNSDDISSFVNNIIKFINLNDKKELGDNAFTYYKKNFKKELFLNTLLKKLKE